MSRLLGLRNLWRKGSVTVRDAVTVPINDAQALQFLLESFTAAEGGASQAWSEVLGADYGTVEFARRHALAMETYSGTLRHIDMLPERSRDRFERYAQQWWNALVAPDHTWGSRASRTDVLSQEALDQLGSAADVIESRTNPHSEAPQSQLAVLREQVLQWTGLIEGEPSLSRTTRARLKDAVDHVVWLIDEAETFGAERVVVAAERLVGALGPVTVQVPESQQPTWKTHVSKLVSALLLFGGLHTTVLAIEATVEKVGDVLPAITRGTETTPSAPGPAGAPTEPDGHDGEYQGAPQTQ